MGVRGFLPSFAGGVIAPGLYGRVDTAKYDVALKQGQNVFIHAHGGFSNRAGFEWICEVPDSTKFTRLIPFERDDEENYILMFGDQVMQVINDGSVVQSGGDYELVTAFSSGATRAAADVADLDFEQSADLLYLCHEDYAPRKISRTAIDNWTQANVAINPTIASPGGVTATPKATSAGLDYKYVVTAVDANDVEGFASSEATATNSDDLADAGMYVDVAWSAVAGASFYYVYRERGGVFGYIGFTDGLTIRDDNISADLTVTPPETASYFGSSNNYPRHVAIWQQRLMFGGSITDLETVWGSRTGDYENFTKRAILQADDRIETGLTGRAINGIRGLLPMRDLICLGDRSVFSLSGPDGAASATNPILKQEFHTGGATVKPLLVDDSAIFVDQTRKVVRDFRYSFQEDGYTGNELSLLSSHLFDGKKIVDWAYARNPESIIWAVLNDGSLISLTYKREHQIWAWTTHTIAGDVESIAAIREDDRDAVYIVVQHTNGTGTRRDVLRLHDRTFATVDDAFFVDFGVSYDGVATTTLTGFDHLEGSEIVVLGDGDVFEGLTVSGGSVTLPQACAKAHGGIFEEAIGETLPKVFDIQGRGTSRGKPQTVSSVGVQVENSRGFSIGTTEGGVLAYENVRPDLAVSGDLITDFVEMTVPPSWNKDGTVLMKQTKPLPLTVLAVVPELSVGR